MGTTRVELFTEEQNRLATLFKAIGHPARVAILQYLLGVEGCINGSLVNELGMAQSTISQHLSVLKNAGLIQGTLDGTRTNYCIDPEGWNQSCHLLGGLLEPLPTRNNDCC